MWVQSMLCSAHFHLPEKEEEERPHHKTPDACLGGRSAQELEIDLKKGKAKIPFLAEAWNEVRVGSKYHPLEMKPAACISSDGKGVLEFKEEEEVRLWTVSELHGVTIWRETPQQVAATCYPAQCSCRTEHEREAQELPLAQLQETIRCHHAFLSNPVRATGLSE